MSEDPTHGASTIRPSKSHDEGGGAGKWLIGAAAAVVLLGGGYFAWQSLGQSQDGVEVADNDPYASGPYANDTMRAAPLDSEPSTLAESASTEESIAAPEEAAPRPAAVRRAPARVVPQETIGITPINATATDSDEIVVTGARRPVWVRTPSARRLSAMYPERALDRGREGEARLQCTVQNGGALDCERISETPGGGFGNAALRVARTYRHAPTLADGSDAAGTPVNLRVVFRLADEETRRG
ncbi:MAG: TonB family protein [Hyphomonadaceae bacterium]